MTMEGESAAQIQLPYIGVVLFTFVVRIFEASFRLRSINKFVFLIGLISVPSFLVSSVFYSFVFGLEVVKHIACIINVFTFIDTKQLFSGLSHFFYLAIQVLIVRGSVLDTTKGFNGLWLWGLINQLLETFYFHLNLFVLLLFTPI